MCGFGQSKDRPQSVNLRPHNQPWVYIIGNQDSSVSVVTSLWAGWPRNHSLIPSRAGDFSLHYDVLQVLHYTPDYPC
jgi:hypothetical protein